MRFGRLEHCVWCPVICKLWAGDRDPPDVRLQQGDRAALLHSVCQSGPSNDRLSRWGLAHSCWEGGTIGFLGNT